MCDSMNYVWDAAHAEAYEKQMQAAAACSSPSSRRAASSPTPATNRMHRYDWPPVSVVNPQRIINGIRMLGVDVSNWEG